MQLAIEKTQEMCKKSAPPITNIEELNELQLALVGGGSVTVIVG